MKVNWVLFSLSTCMFLAAVGTSIPNIALPTLVQALPATFSEIQWVIVSYLLANTISIVLVGRIGDIFGRQKVLLIGILMFSLSAFFGGLANSLWTLIAARIIQGIGSAILMALSVALIGELIPKDKMGRAMGLLGTSSAVGTASGPSIGGLILASFGWKFIFYFMGLLGLVGFAIAYFAFPKTVASPSVKRRILIPLATFKEMNLTPSLIMNICVSAIMMATLIVGPFYLTKSLGLGAAMVGAVMTVGPLMSILSGIPAGRIVDRIGPSKVIKFGLFQLLVGAICFSFLPAHFGVIGYIISAAVLSPGYQMFQAANNSMVMMGVPDDQRGVISGILSLSRNIGLISGASVMGAIFASQGMPMTFLAAAILALFALVLSTRRSI